MKFQKGDFVICINNSTVYGVISFSAPELVLNKEYRIINIMDSGSINVGGVCSYFEQRFILSKRVIWNKEIEEILNEV
jgi:hypothetical protein